METRFKVKSTDTAGILEASRKMAEESAQFYGKQPEALIEQYAQSMAESTLALQDIGDEYIYAIMEGHRGGWSNKEMDKQPTSTLVNGLNGTIEYSYEENGADLDPMNLAKDLDISEELAKHMVDSLRDEN